MAEWMEVMSQFDRMCRHYQRKRECPMGCPMNGVNISQCRKVAFEQPEVTEKTVMDWAAEHPEPVYPTWFEYLYAINNPDYFDLTEFYTWMRHTPIPADIAQKLGIEPLPKN